MHINLCHDLLTDCEMHLHRAGKEVHWCWRLRVDSELENRASERSIIQRKVVYTTAFTSNWTTLQLCNFTNLCQLQVDKTGCIFRSDQRVFNRSVIPNHSCKKFLHRLKKVFLLSEKSVGVSPWHYRYLGNVMELPPSPTVNGSSCWSDNIFSWSQSTNVSNMEYHEGACKETCSN